jgi:hypothetical protein
VVADQGFGREHVAVVGSNSKQILPWGEPAD